MKLYISVLNCVSCVAVVLLHTNGIFWSHPSGELWISANFIETYFYWAVPIFFMISGATLMDYRERYTTAEFYKNRIKKTVVPFVFWSLISGMFMAYISEVPMDWNIIHIIDNTFNTRYFSIYWFFIPLFAIYISFPIISFAAENIQLMTFFALIGSIVVFTLPLLCELFHITMNKDVVPPVVSGYMVYIFLGYILDKVTLDKKKRWSIYIVGIIGWFIHFEGTSMLSTGAEINTMFKGYTNFLCLLQSVAIFVLFKYMDYKKIFGRFYHIVSDMIFKCAKCTFGVYLLHYFFVIGLPKEFNIDGRRLIWRVGGGILIFLICALFTHFAKKNQIIRKVLP